MNHQQEPILRDLVDASVDGILAFDRECRYTVWNPAMERISGLRREDVLGRCAFDLFPFLTETGEDNYFYEALAGRASVSESRPYVVPETGRRGLFDGYYSPLYDEGGEVVGGLAVVRDTTARKEAEEALRAGEERYRAFIANSSEGIWRFELEQPIAVDLPADEQIELCYQHGYLAECNDAMARMYGYERAAEITGARLGDLLIRSDAANDRYLRRFLASGYRLTDVESVEVDRQGRRRAFANNLIGVVERGLLLRAWGTQRDITERKRGEDELRATQHRFRTFMENLPGLAWIKDARGRYVYANELAARAFGAARAELYGKTDDELFPPATAAQFRENDRRALTSREGVQTVETLEQEDGVHYSMVSKFPLLGPSGETEMVGGVAVDITEHKQAEIALSRLSAIVESSDDAIIGKTLDGIITSWNRGAEKLYGYTAQEVIGRHVSLLAPPERADEIPNILERLSRGERVDHYETERVAKDGRRLHISLTISVIRNREGHIVGASTIARDITEKKRAEQRLSALQSITAAFSEARTSAEVARVVIDQGLSALGAYGGSVMIPGEDGRALETLSVIGYPQDVLDRWQSVPLDAPTPAADAFRRGEPVVLLSRDERFMCYSHLAEVQEQVKGGAVASVPLKVEGRVIGVMSLSFPEGRALGDDDQALMLLLGQQCAQALHRSQLYEAEQRARSQAESANRMKDEFLATVSHELRTPLTAIMGWSRMLSSGSLDPATAEHAVDVILRNAQAQAQIVEDILEVSRIITGKIRLNTQRIDPAPAVAAAIEAVRPAAEAKGITVESALDPRAGPVLADPDRLQQIAWNLLSNALKFTPRGGRVDVRLYDLNGHAHLEVRDTGQGISPEFLPHVFERFRQADMGTTRLHGGLGLGLAIVRHLTELQGGTVSAASEGAGKGAVFSVDLPRDENRAERALLDVRLRPGQPDEVRTHADHELPRLTGARLLVVEDEADTSDFLAVLLGRCGAEVRTARSAQEALSIFAAWRPHCLISDLGLPREDGYSLIRSVRELEAGAGTRTPAVALSGYARNEDRALSLASGFEQHLAKPVEPFELATAVARLIDLESG